MNEIYTIRITAAGQTAGGKSIAVGTIINDAHAWRHCLPGFRNRPPVAEPVGESTIAKVAAEKAKRNNHVAVMTPVIQQDVDRLAAKLPTDEAGQFVRNTDGTIPNAKQADQITIDSAAAYGIMPTPPPAESVATINVDPEPEPSVAVETPVVVVPTTPPTMADIAEAVDAEVAADSSDFQATEAEATTVGSAYTLPE